MQTVHEIPPSLRAVLQRDPMETEASPMFSAALGYVRAGFPVVPCTEDTKKPHVIGQFRHGARSATIDYETARDHWYAYPWDNVALAPEGTFVLLDIDPRNGGSLERAEGIGLPVDGYRERTVSGGYRIPLVMPAGIVAVRSAEPAPGVEVKAQGTCALAPHSRIDARWYHVEPGRDVWQFGAIPERWQHLDRLRTSTSAASALAVTAADRRDAAGILQRMRGSSKFGPGAVALLENHPDWPRHFPTARDKSQSGRDFQLALAASHFVRDHERVAEVLFALLGNHSIKASTHANPEQYIESVVASALNVRHDRDRKRLSSLLGTLVPDLHAPPHVLDGTPALDGRQLDTAILAFTASSEMDAYRRDDRWRRIPVQDIADLHGVDRRTVTRRLKALEDRGLIERQVVAHQHDGRPRRDSLVRLREAHPWT